MAKPNPLSQGLERITRPAVTTPPSQPPEPARTRMARTPAREGQILVGAFFSPEVHKQLKVLAAEQAETQQALIAEALNMLFAKHGKPEIATLGRILKKN